MDNFKTYYERQEYLRDLRNDVRTPIEIFFEKKLKNAEISESLDNELWDKVEETIDKIHDLLYELDKDIDNNIEDFDKEQEIKNIKDDMATQDELERGLWVEV